MNDITNYPIEDCVGRGTRVDDTGLARKLSVLKESRRFHGQLSDPVELLETYSGFEIAMIFGAMCQTASHKMLKFLEAKPILNMKMRLCEGSGCALAYPIIKAAVNFINETASFESAGVNNRS